MSCALPKAFSVGASPTGDGPALQVRLREELEMGLHAMAQPLTVLRCALGAISSRSGVTTESNHYLEMSHQQVERLCTLMSGLRNLLDAFQSEAVFGQVDLWEMIVSLLEENDSTLHQSGVRVAAAEPDRPVHVFGDFARTAQAIEASLSAAMSLSSKGDVLQLSVVFRDGYADLTVENKNSRGKDVRPGERLQLSLAEVNIRSQQGFYECSKDPLRISMGLPLFHQQERSFEAASDCASLHEVD